MILILSGAYIENEMAAELGMIPPSFLPVGNKRLYTHQINWMEERQEEKYISIPEGYNIEGFDEEYFKSNGIVVVRVPEGLSLGESLVYCWNSIGKDVESLKILHGDTLILDASIGKSDCLSISKNKGFYQRAAINDANNSWVNTEKTADDELVYSGYFSFSKPRELIKKIVRFKFDFIGGVSSYCQEYDVEYEYCEQWLDFGHLNTYFRARALMTTQRVFNAMEISTKVVKKSSCKKEKMFGEYQWFVDVPMSMRLYLPHVLDFYEDSKSAGYSLEYLYLSSLSDLFVFSTHPHQTWGIIFRSCFEFLHGCQNFPIQEDIKHQNFNSLYLEKTLIRLAEFHNQTGFDIERDIIFNGEVMPSLLEISKQVAGFINDASKDCVSISHGDFCFSNILYDFKAQSIKVIDPRGVDVFEKPTIYGDSRYDLAKIYHSVVGLYDYIIAGCYELEGDDYNFRFSLNYNSRILNIQNEFEKVFFHDDSNLKEEIHAICIHLFLSMLPLHSDCHGRQKALLANALRLYKTIKT